MGSEAFDIFAKLSKFKSTVEDHYLKIIVKFMITMYDRSCTVAGVNAALFEMYARKQNTYEAIPTTRTALLRHATSAQPIRLAAFRDSRE